MDYNRKKVTMGDIANHLGISKNSVSIALNNKKGVSDELRRQIIETAKQMNYGSLSAVSEAKSKCIMAIVPEYLHQDTFFYADIFWSIEKEAKNEGCISIMTSVSKSAEKSLTLPQLPAEVDIIGFLVIGIMSEAYIALLTQTGFPLITVDISYHNSVQRSVTSANLSGGFLATKHLIQKGHRKIGFIGPIYSAQSIYERWCGYVQAMNIHGIQVDQAYFIGGSKNEFKLFDSVEALDPFIDAIHTHPSAWFCAGDRIAIALISILTRKGFKVPDEISVMGFDDIPMSRLVFPPLTTMHVNRALMGRLAVYSLIQGDANPYSKAHISLPVTLVERDSVKKPPSKDLHIL